MSSEDYEQIKDLIEDASWRIIGLVVGILGHYWWCAICLLTPLVLKKVAKVMMRRRIAQLESELNA